MVVDRMGVKLLTQGLQDPSPKVQQPVLNILNLALGELNARSRQVDAPFDPPQAHCFLHKRTVSSTNVPSPSHTHRVLLKPNKPQSHAFQCTLHSL